MPAIWAPHGVGPRDEELFVGRSRDIANHNRFDPRVLRERGPFNSVPCTVVDGKIVRVEEPPRPQPPKPAPPSSTASGSFARRHVPRQPGQKTELAQLQGGLDDIRERLNRAS